MPIVTPSGVVIHNVVACLTAEAGQVPDPGLLFPEELQPAPRLWARPDCDPRALTLAVRIGASVRCAAAPHRLIDLAGMRQHAGRLAGSRFHRWRRRPGRARLRAWERDALAQGRDVFVEYHRLRSVAADALVHVEGPTLCPRDTSMQECLRYAREANQLLDELPGDTLLIAATI
jgi:hypothetical protein